MNPRLSLGNGDNVIVGQLRRTMGGGNIAHSSAVALKNLTMSALDTVGGWPQLLALDVIHTAESETGKR